MKKFKAAVLGATGMVGQRIALMLSVHPQFEVTALCASERSAGRSYREAAKWVVADEMPARFRDVVVQECSAKNVDADIAFSALPAAEAALVEKEFAAAGVAVSSNASAHRMEEDVPLVIPEVNPEHLGLIDVQRRKRGWDGLIVTNPNCTTVVFALAAKPLSDAFGVKTIIVTSMQALSGAGYPGVASLDAVANVVPFIQEEEEKVGRECGKIFGRVAGEKIERHHAIVSASCNRVPTREGHMESVSVSLEKNAGAEEAKRAMREFRGLPQKLGLHSAPANPVIVMEENDRPQPVRDVMRGGGMSVCVGRVREEKALENGLKFTVLGSNTIRGAAGAAILNAELLAAQGYL
ncbi:MAG: aspartate-semialdehyde dehydrogenase [Candidatus Micrarchaeota archaeon]|nr:aspartate-semialdehyde dehydrogenase [Candidatus Micrarchaeota archaeon]